MLRRVLCVLFTLLIGWSVGVLGLSSEDEVAKLNEKLERELRAQSPELADLFLRAVTASEAEDHRTAADLYAQLHQQVPGGFTPALRRQGGEELRLGNRDKAVALCREAVSREESADNLGALSVALSQNPQGAEGQEALDLALRATVQEPRNVHAYMALANAAVVTNDLIRLEHAANQLVALAPQDSFGYYSQAIVRATKGNFGAAEESAQQARERGLPEESYQELVTSLRAARPWTSRLPELGVLALSAWLGPLLLLLLLGWLLSRAALRTAERMPSQPTGQAVGLDARLRHLYKGVLWLSCLYYWISIPILVLAVIALAGGLLFAIFAFGHIPVKLILIIVVVAGVTLVSIFKSLFVRGRDEDPGLRMDLAEEPRLAAVLREVAERIGTRPVDNVYLTPGTDLAVMERGGMLKQMRGGSERCLILGVAVLEGMALAPFKAILAHEYGHFSNRDTAGGGLALAVRRSLLTMAHHMAEGGAAAWFNPAWLFVNGFHRVFLRISQGASRLQEVLADRWAAFTYGGLAFERGLRHVIERSVRFNAFASAALNEVIEKKEPLANLYTYRTSLLDPASIDHQVEEALMAEASPYDSHPAPSDRIRWARALGSGQAVSDDDEQEVWSLFRDREEIERRLTAQVRDNVHAAHDIRIPETAEAAAW